jgi:hypothetical protein
VTVEVESGATAIVDLGPTVVAAGAEHTTSTRVRLAEGARLLLRELVVLGRTDEAPGHSTGRLDVTIGARPLIRELLVRPAGVASAAVDDGRRASAAMVAVGFDPVASGPTGSAPTASSPVSRTGGASWLALPGQHGWRSVDLDDDVAALQVREDGRWRSARAVLG